MDGDYGRAKVPQANVTSVPAAPPPPSSAKRNFIDGSQNESRIPYLAKLAAFSLLFLGVLYSLSSLINYLVEKLVVKQQSNGPDYSYFSGVDSFLVISAIATLIVALPASALLLFFVRRSENNQNWRTSQKWRRIIYTIVQVVLIITIISTLIGVVYSVFSHSLSLEVSSSYYGDSSSSDKKPDNGSKIAAAVISGLVAILIYILGMLTFMGEYAAKWRQLAWGVLVLFSLTGAVVGVASVLKVQEQIKKQNDSQPKYDSGSVESSGSDYSNSSSSATSDLKNVKSDLSFYASSNGNKYPTKAQWDNGSLKPKYLLSSDEKLKKITYTPTDCDATGCTAYTISTKDETGEAITLSSSE